MDKYLLPYDPPATRYIRLTARSFFLGAFLTMLMFASCRKDPYVDQSVNNELVILAEITAGDSLVVPVSKSIQVGTGGIISFEKVNSASVKVIRADGRTWTLKLNTSPLYANNPASVYTTPQKPRYGTVYNLQVQDPLSGSVTAQTTIPSPVNVLSADTSSDYRNGVPVMRLRFTINDTPGVVNYYVFEALKEILQLQHYFYWQGIRYNYDKPDGKNLYDQIKNTPGVRLLCDTISSGNFRRLNVFTDDGNVDNAQVAGLDSPFRRIFLSGHVFNGNYSTSFYVDRKYFIADNPGDRGRILLQVKSVSIELYNYLFWYEKYKTDIGSVPPEQLYSPPGNIQNGLGIFGGSSKRQWTYYFDELR